MAGWMMWMVLAGVLVILEMFSGTFYLLMLSLGLAAGGVAAMAGSGLEVQMLAAACVGVAATVLLRKSRFGRNGKTDAATDPNVNLDIGQQVVIPRWNTETGSARVMYRGAQWDVVLADGATARPGNFIIREIRGSHLVVANKPD